MTQVPVQGVESTTFAKRVLGRFVAVVRKPRGRNHSERSQVREEETTSSLRRSCSSLLAPIELPDANAQRFGKLRKRAGVGSDFASLNATKVTIGKSERTRQLMLRDGPRLPEFGNTVRKDGGYPRFSV